MANVAVTGPFGSETRGSETRATVGTAATDRSGLLYPLDEFYRRAGLVVPRATPVPGHEVPEPYRSLLVHDRDMTPTLEAYHRERIHLRVIGRREDPDALSRLVVLAGKESGKGVEFGAIVIHLDPFPPEARALVLESRCPLGTILADYHIEHSSHPEAYFQVATDSLVKGALDLTGPVILYGRKNVMVTSGGAPLAEVVEILPPAVV